MRRRLSRASAHERQRREYSCTGETGDSDLCLTRGGDFDSGGAAADGQAPKLQCNAHEASYRNDTYFAIGFRCCSK